MRWTTPFRINSGRSRSRRTNSCGVPDSVAVNDGEFRPSDYEAICSFGLNSKAGDAATIGKFGLGMKSVFHLCEAIFFMGGGDGFRLPGTAQPVGKGLSARLGSPRKRSSPNCLHPCGGIA